MVAVIEVALKDDERKLRKQFLIYEPFSMHENDPFVAKCIKETIDEFKGEADDIKVKATMVIK